MAIKTGEPLTLLGPRAVPPAGHATAALALPESLWVQVPTGFTHRAPGIRTATHMFIAATHVFARRPAPWFHRTSLRNAGPEIKLLRVSRRRHEGIKPYWAGGSPFEIGLHGRAQCVTVRQLKSQKWFGLRCPLIQRFVVSGSHFPFLHLSFHSVCLGPYVLVPSFDWLPTRKQNGCRHSRSFIHIMHTQNERFSLLVKRGLRVHVPMCWVPNELGPAHALHR